MLVQVHDRRYRRKNIHISVLLAVIFVWGLFFKFLNVCVWEEGGEGYAEAEDVQF